MGGHLPYQALNAAGASQSSMQPGAALDGRKHNSRNTFLGIKSLTCSFEWDSILIRAGADHREVKHALLSAKAGANEKGRVQNERGLLI
jgi:hypothetical protein